jgi:site-specific DNA-methyltransferase (adenine-specific)
VTAPYYQDAQVTLYHGDCQAVLAGMAERSVDCVITDPPYSERTHENVRSNSAGAQRQGNRVLSGKLGFDAISEASLRAVIEECGRITRRWVVTNLDYRHAFQFETAPPKGLRLLRVGVRVKTNPMPQISGDRPGQGWEAIAFFHRDDLRPTWNGGGRAGVWVASTRQNTGHPTSKPLSMVQDWVRLFTDPGDVVLDPFAGSGTTLRAAKDEGRRAIGVELEERYCEVIARRLAQDCLPLGEVTA